MCEIKVLIAEDEDDQIELYLDAIGDFNNDNEKVKIVSEIVKTKDKAIEQLEKNYFDAVFIDLNLSPKSHSDDKPEGNELVGFIKKFMMYPVFVVTGKINDDIVEMSKNNSFIELHIKGEDDLTNRLLERVKKIYDTGITKVLGSQGTLNRHIHSIFWKHLSTTLNHWVDIEYSNCDIEKIISRYAITHLYEYMEENEGQEKIVYDPAEMYICPRVKSSIRPGDIVKKGNDKFLVLTPACTIAKKCDLFQLIKIVNLADNVDIVKIKNKVKDSNESITAIETSEKFSEDELLSLNEKNEKAIGSLKGLIGNYISNTKGDRFHFLPSFLDFKDSLIDFQDITTVSQEDISEYIGEMTISIYFFKDVQARFSAFYARQGSPDFDGKTLSKGIMERILAV